MSNPEQGHSEDQPKIDAATPRPLEPSKHPQNLLIDDRLNLLTAEGRIKKGWIDASDVLDYNSLIETRNVRVRTMGLTTAEIGRQRHNSSRPRSSRSDIDPKN